jgi:hypothetical protein
MASDKHRIVPENLLRRQEITRESLVALIAVAESLNLGIPWWEKYGQPAFDKVVAVFEGPAESAGAVVERILKVEGITPQIRIFPYGIPAVTNVRIEVEASGASG